MTKHPHHEVIVAYLEGKEVEVYMSGYWQSLRPHTGSEPFPGFYYDFKYRVKPKPVTKIYSMKIYPSKNGTLQLRELEHWESTPDVIITTVDGELTNIERVVK